MVVATAFCVSVSFAGFTTSFESGEGYTDGSTIVPVQNWTNTGSGSDARGIATSTPTPPGPHKGGLFARVMDWNNTTGIFTRQFSENERIGATGETYTCVVSVWMAAHTAHSGGGLLYIQGNGSNLATDTAAVFGFNGSNFVYNSGGYITTTETFTPDTWYRFDATLYGNGSGSGTWDLTISGGDLSANIVRTGLSYRCDQYNTTVPYIGYVSMYSSKGSGDGTGMNAEDGHIYFDAISIAAPVPTGTFIVIR